MTTIPKPLATALYDLRRSKMAAVVRAQDESAAAYVERLQRAECEAFCDFLHQYVRAYGGVVGGLVVDPDVPATPGGKLGAGIP